MIAESLDGFEVRDLRNGEWRWVHQQVLDRLAGLKNHQVVYLQLCAHVRTEAQRVWPGISTLASKSGLSARHVMRVLKDLKVKKVIDYRRKYDGGPNIYYLLKVQGLSPVTPETPPPDKGDRRVVTPETPEIEELKYKKEVSKDIAVASAPAKVMSDAANGHHPDLGRQAQEFLKGWCLAYEKTVGSKYMVNGAKDITLVKRMIGTFGPEDLAKRATAFLKSQDKFIVEAGRTIGVLFSQVNKFSGKADGISSWAAKHGLNARG